MLNKEYYTLREVADKLGLQYQVVKNYVYNENRIESVKKYNSRLVTKEELEKQMTLRELI